MVPKNLLCNMHRLPVACLHFPPSLLTATIAAELIGGDVELCNAVCADACKGGCDNDRCPQGSTSSTCGWNSENPEGNAGKTCLLGGIAGNKCIAQGSDAPDTYQSKDCVCEATNVCNSTGSLYTCGPFPTQCNVQASGKCQ